MSSDKEILLDALKDTHAHMRLLAKEWNHENHKALVEARERAVLITSSILECEKKQSGRQTYEELSDLVKQYSEELRVVRNNRDSLAKDFNEMYELYKAVKPYVKYVDGEDYIKTCIKWVKSGTQESAPINPALENVLAKLRAVWKESDDEGEPDDAEIFSTEDGEIVLTTMDMRRWVESEGKP
jgi:hypothetical protein